MLTQRDSLPGHRRVSPPAPQCLAILALVGIQLVCRAAFQLPGPLGSSRWEAEDAVAYADWERVSHAWAGNGAYVRTSSHTQRDAPTLDFEFEVTRPLTLRVRPVWWRHGERNPAVRFPAPLPRTVGPSALQSDGHTLYFTAPATGRIGLLDTAGAALTGHIDIGGYPLDLAVGPEGRLLYVADPSRDVVAIVEPAAREIVAEVVVPGMPWSVARHGKRLFVACLTGNCVAVVDTEKRQLLGRVSVGAPVRSVRIVDGRVVAVRQPLVLLPDSLAPQQPDRFAYFTPGRRKAGYPTPMPVENADRQPKKRFDVTRPHAIRVQSAGAQIDVTEVTGGPPAGGDGARPDVQAVGPIALDELGEELFFLAPAAGKVGVVNMKDEHVVGSAEVGGRPVDLVSDPGRKRVYVADTAGDRVVCLDGPARTVVGVVRTPREPVSLALHEHLLYVACREARSLFTVDVRTLESGPSLALPDKPLAVHRVRLYPDYTFFASGRWPHTYYLPPDSEAPYRIVVELPQQVVIDPATLRVLDSREAPPQPPPRRECTTVVAVRDRPFDLPLPAPDGLLAQWGPWPDENAALACAGTGAGAEAGTPVGVGVEEDPVFRHVLRFDGRKSKVEFPHSAGLMPEQGLTVEAWVTWDGPGSSHPDGRSDPSSCVVGKRGPNSGYMLMIRNDGRAFLDINGLNHKKDLDLAMIHSRSPVTRGRWAHVVGVYDPDGPKMAVYVNGVGALHQPPKPMHASNTVLGIGSQPGWYWFKGMIAMVRLYSRPLEPGEIREAYEAHAPEKTRTFLAEDNSAALCVDGATWLDLRSVCDPQLDPAMAVLKPGDQPGTVTLALDEGPEHDWRRNTWLTPDNELFLVNGTREFQRWNDVLFRLAPGQHRLRVSARSPFAALDAIEVEATLEQTVSVTFLPGPRTIHAAVPRPSYHGVFYDEEPVNLTVELGNRSGRPQRLDCAYSVISFLGERLDSGRHEARVPALGKTAFEIAPGLDEWGIFELRTTVSSTEGDLTDACVFLRLPKLEHPRLLFRRDRDEEIRSRLRRHPRLFDRYASWLLRHRATKGFLPTSLLHKYPNERPYFNVIAKWRAIACQFAAMFIADGAQAQALTVATSPLLGKGRADQHTFVHNWLRGALPFLYDLAGADSEAVRQQFLSLYPRAWEDQDRREESLLVLREPLTPGMRASLHQQAVWLLNIDRYFSAHAGTRGGNYYQGIHSFCVCPVFGTLGAHILYRNVFGMPRLFERPHFRGWFTHYRYVQPPDSPACGLARGGLACGGPTTGRDFAQVNSMVRAVAGLCRHPLEKGLMDWDQRIAALDGDATLGDTEVDALLEGVGVCVPLFLALGWYEPTEPTVQRTDLPPTALFDAEGHVAMRTSWDDTATSLVFACGPRDCSDRFRAGHIRLTRGDDVLLTAPSARRGDHGQAVPSWANTVTVGDSWQPWWMRGVGHPRGMEERLVLNRYAPAVKVYEQSNLAFLTGHVPEHVKQRRYYTLSFHEHVQNPFIREGEIVAYSTHPAFDYAAGDMTSAWRSDEVDEAYRQIVFVRPGCVVVYDRLRMRRDGLPTRWLAATRGSATVGASGFSTESGASVLHGQVLLPEEAKLDVANTRDFGESISMNVVVIEPRRKGSVAEYLVVMETGPRERTDPSVSARLSQAAQTHIGVTLGYGTQDVRLAFRRAGPVGGQITVTGAGETLTTELPQRIVDSYDQWRDHPMHPRWTADPAFRFLGCRE